MILRGRKGWLVVASLVCGGLAAWLWLLRSGDEVVWERRSSPSAVAVSEVLEVEGVGNVAARAAGDGLSLIESEGEVVDEAFWVDAVSGTGKRVRLVEASGFDYPILVVRDVEVDAKTGEERTRGLVEMAADRVIARFRDGFDEAVARERLRLMDIRLGRRLMTAPVYELFFADAALDTVPEGMSRLLDGSFAGDLAYVEPNYIVHAYAEPNDPSYLDGSLWGLRNTGQNGGVADVDIGAAEGWELRTDASSVVVAVIDTGINYHHRDLASNLWVNPGEVPGNGIDDDGNGFVDDVYGINAIRMDGDPMDDNGHGTHCSGTIGASGNDGQGVVGVAWQLRLMGTKFLSENGSGDVANAISCIDYAVSMGADVLSNSWGGAGYSQALRDVISLAEERGVVFVAAAGNSSVDIDESASYPAGYDLENVISVASIDRSGKLSRFSNYGVQAVDVAAPGEDILSTWIGGDGAYRTISGTSMAAPHVSGIMALLYAQYPESGVEENVGRLFYGARVLPELEDVARFGAMANLGVSLRLIEVPKPPRFLARPDRDVLLIEGADLVLSAEVESELPVSFQWYFEEEELLGETQARLELEALDQGMSGVYRLVATNEDGSASVASKVTVLTSRPQLAQAVDSPNSEFFSYGKAEWVSYLFDSALGESSARSGEIGDGEESALFTEIRGPGRVSFFWRVSSEANWDKGEFWVNGERVATLAANEDWREYSLSLEEGRSYRLEWRYVKDGSGASGQDALFLDGFKFEVEGNAAPVIVEQPRGGILGTGVYYELSVLAAGDDLEYRWLKDGIAVSGATRQSLGLVADSPDKAGEYVAIVSNGFGEARSEGARIQIADVPARIERQPVDLILETGMSGVFEASVAGSLPLSLQWYRDGVALVGENDARLFLASVKREDAGDYVLRVSNAFTLQAVSAKPVRLSVNDVNLAPRIVKHPGSGYLQSGERLRLSAAVEGSFPMDYQWFKDGKEVAGAVGRSLLLESVSPEDEGAYALEARNAFGGARSEAAAIRILGDLSEGLDLAGQAWRIEGAAYFFAQGDTTFDGEDALQSSRVASLLGEPTALETDIVGPTNFSLYWKQEVESVASRLSLYVDDKLVAQLNKEVDWKRVQAWIPEGRHTVKILGLLEIGSTVWLDKAEVDARPVVYHDSGSVAVNDGQAFRLWAEVYGAGDLSYQWYRNEAAIQGAVGPEYAVSKAGRNDEGRYRVDTTNSLGVTRSRILYVRTFDSLASELGDGTVRLELGYPDSWIGQIRTGGAIGLRSGGSLVEKERELVGYLRGPGTLVFDLGIVSNGCCASLGVWVDGEEIVRYSDTQDSASHVALLQRSLWIDAGDHLVVWKFDKGENAPLRSREAFLSSIRVTQDPVFSLQPKDTRVVEGQDAKLQVGIVGPGVFTYQWFKDEVSLVGETSTILRVSAADGDDDGQYWCRVGNEAGAVALSSRAKLTVVTGFYEALGLSFGKLAVGGADWEPRSGGGRAGGSALAFAGSSAGSLSTLAIELEVPVGERRGVAFWIRVSGMKEGSAVRVVENSGKRIEINRDADWQRVVLPLARGGRNRLTINVSKGGGTSWSGLEVLLDGFELVDAPLFYNSPQSGSRYWGETFSLGAETTGTNPKTYRWEKAGAAGAGEHKPAWMGSQLYIDRVSDVTTGGYRLEVSNQKGSILSEEAKLELLTTRYGAAVGAPGASVWSEGRTLWEVDDSSGAVGEKSLRVAGLDPQERSDLVFWIRGPGVLSMKWKLDTPSGDDRLSLFVGGTQVNGLFASSDWKGITFWVDGEFYQVRVRMSNLSSSAEDRGRAWVDSIRFSNDGALRYLDWAEEVFGATNIPEESRSLEADPDEDGVVNFVEYAFAASPFLSNKMPVLKRFEEDGSTGVVVDFPLEAMADDISFGLELSRDLKTWYPLRSQFLVSEDGGKYQGTLVYKMRPEERPESAFIRFAVYYLGDSE